MDDVILSIDRNLMPCGYACGWYMFFIDKYCSNNRNIMQYLMRTGSDNKNIDFAERLLKQC